MLRNFLFILCLIIPTFVGLSSVLDLVSRLPVFLIHWTSPEEWLSWPRPWISTAGRPGWRLENHDTRPESLGCITGNPRREVWVQNRPWGSSIPLRCSQGIIFVVVLPFFIFVTSTAPLDCPSERVGSLRPPQRGGTRDLGPRVDVPLTLVDGVLGVTGTWCSVSPTRVCGRKGPVGEYTTSVQLSTPKSN